MTDFIGIDPGLRGAVALIAGDRLKVYDMPTLEYVIAGKKKRSEIDIHRLYKIFFTASCPLQDPVCYLEGVAGMPGMGGTQMFAFGQAYGMTKAAIALSHIPYEIISPQKWKNHYGLTRDKAGSFEMASEIFPDFKHLWTRKKDDGRAEAALIANYARELTRAKSTNQKELFHG